MPDELARLREQFQTLAMRTFEIDTDQGEVCRLVLRDLAAYFGLDLIVLDYEPQHDLVALADALQRHLHDALREPTHRDEAVRIGLAAAKALLADVERPAAPDGERIRPQ